MGGGNRLLPGICLLMIFAPSGLAAPADLDGPPAGQVVRVASISMRPRQLALQENAHRLMQAFREARGGGAQIAVAPEGVLEGYVVNEIIAGSIPESAMREVALSMDDPWILRFRQLARELSMCLVFGFAEKMGDDVFNCAVFIDHEGEIRHRYHKMQLAEGYHADWWFNRLGTEMRAFDTPHGRCGLLICNDRWNSDLARVAALDGAQFFCIPAFGSRSLRQDQAVLDRGMENDVPVVEANVGVCLVVDGNQIATVQRFQEGIVWADIHIGPPRAVRGGERDRLEADFMRWRSDEMPRRYAETIDKLRRRSPGP